eukprot:7849060-Pyramimonas_sp.AAC.1
MAGDAGPWYAPFSHSRHAVRLPVIVAAPCSMLLLTPPLACPLCRFLRRPPPSPPFSPFLAFPPRVVPSPRSPPSSVF